MFGACTGRGCLLKSKTNPAKAVASNVDMARLLVKKPPSASKRLEPFASSGRSDRSKMERDLHVWMSVAKHLGVELEYLQLRVLTERQLRPETVSVLVMPLHLLLHALHTQGPQQFRIACLGAGGLEGIHEFWKSATH